MPKNSLEKDHIHMCGFTERQIYTVTDKTGPALVKGLALENISRYVHDSNRPGFTTVGVCRGHVRATLCRWEYISPTDKFNHLGDRVYQVTRRGVLAALAWWNDHQDKYKESLPEGLLAWIEDPKLLEFKHGGKRCV